MLGTWNVLVSFHKDSISYEASFNPTLAPCFVRGSLRDRGGMNGQRYEIETAPIIKKCLKQIA